ncbi:MAG: DUF481 domain-containing protein [Myxococcales bacterium FL481]|nr:MAG: DUF481 domain-containing protein [Myxococcales bacterium FL481]
MQAELLRDAIVELGSTQQTKHRPRDQLDREPADDKQHEREDQTPPHRDHVIGNNGANGLTPPRGAEHASRRARRCAVSNRSARSSRQTEGCAKYRGAPKVAALRSPSVKSRGSMYRHRFRNQTGKEIDSGGARPKGERVWRHGCEGEAQSNDANVNSLQVEIHRLLDRSTHGRNASNQRRTPGQPPLSLETVAPLNRDRPERGWGGLPQRGMAGQRRGTPTTPRLGRDRARGRSSPSSACGNSVRQRESGTHIAVEASMPLSISTWSRARSPRLVAGLSFALLAGLRSSVALGAPAPLPDPSGTGGAQAPASSGSTELDGQGKFATTNAPESTESEDTTELTLSAGGILSTGNARSAAVTGAADFRLRRSIHQFSATAAGNYGSAAVDADSDMEQTVGNVQGRARYDIYFHRQWSAFGMATARHDPFQGLDLRLNLDPGVAFYALHQPNHRLWFEAGYDFQFDVRTDDAIIERDDNGDPVLDEDGDEILLDKTAVNHAARLFAGYSNRLDERVTFSTGVEYLQSVLEGDRFRLNWDNALTTQLSGNFSLAATFTLRYDNAPLPDIDKLDTVSSLSLVFKLP